MDSLCQHNAHLFNALRFPTFFMEDHVILMKSFLELCIFLNSNQPTNPRNYVPTNVPIFMNPRKLGPTKINDFTVRIKLFCFKKAYFCNFTKILVVVSTQPTCPVHLYCTSYNICWYRSLGGREVSAVGRSAPCTLSFCYACRCGFDTPMWYFFFLVFL